jgi:transposase-like protein
VSEKTKKRPSYSPEFKSQAVAKCLNIGVNATSRELGVSSVTLRDWVQKSGGKHVPSGTKPSYEELEREVQKLRREVGYINEINRILKKSTAIFSASEMGGLR